MRLTLVLLKKRHVIPGHRWMGKHRLPHKIYEHTVDKAVKELQVEERNLFLVRHPYLTREQEVGYDRETKSGHLRVEEDKRLRACLKVVPSVRVEDRLAHLRYTDIWETFK